MTDMTLETQGTFLGPSALFAKSWEIFKAKWKTLVLITLVPTVLAFGLILVVIVLLVIMGVANKGSMTDINAIMAGAGIFVFLFIAVAYVVLIVISLWSQMAMLMVVAKYNEQIGVKQAYEMAKGKIWPYLTTGFVVGLLVMAGYAFFLIPGLVIALWFCFAGFVVLDEGKTGLTAALTSRGYMRGRELGVFGRMLVFGLVYIGVYILVVALQAAMGGSKEMGLLSIILSLASSVVFFVLNLIGMIYAYIVYANIKQLQGGNVEIAPSTRKKYVWFGVGGFILAIVLYGLLISMIVGSAMDSFNKSKLNSSETDQMMLEDADNSNDGDDMIQDMPEDYRYNMPMDEDSMLMEPTPDPETLLN